MLIKTSVSAIAAAALTFLPTVTFADYPDRPIKLIVPFAAGGNADIQGRIIAEQMQKVLGRPVVIENRAGAGGSIGAEAVARSDPDGYTLLIGSNGPMTVNPIVQKISYDTFKDFVPVSLTSYVPHTLVVNPKVEAKSVAELLALSKKRPINIGVAGIGSATHMTVERIKASTGASFGIVPYRSGGALTPDLIAGNIDAAVTEFSTAFPLHKDGIARIIAVASQQRTAAAPDIPTLIESGVNVTAESFIGILAPAKTPKEIVQLLEKAVARGMKEGGGADKIRALGAEIATDKEMSSAGLAAYLSMDHERTKAAAKNAGLGAK
jgi:tripartite-type tricarboxylate transporter receptor subunit TctC